MLAGWYFAIPPRAQVPVFARGVIVYNMTLCASVKDPTRPRFYLARRTNPVKRAGDTTSPVIFFCRTPRFWSVLGTSLYAFGIGMIFLTLFRFTLFPTTCQKGRPLALAEHGDSDGDGGVE